MRIGLLEDDISTQEMVLLVLQEDGHTVTAYANAELCLAALGVDVVEPSPIPIDLLIVDWRLGGTMTGIEVIKKIRQNKRLEHLPIILTTAAPFNNIELLQTLHAALLEKPFSVDDMIALVKQIMQT
jgi:DNA-binding response OmpR family regulator